MLATRVTGFVRLYFVAALLLAPGLAPAQQNAAAEPPASLLPRPSDIATPPGLPPIGKWMIDAIGKRDYVVVQSGLLIIALIVMAVNLIVDVLYAVINPRIRVQ